jgi:hypothetical protein
MKKHKSLIKKLMRTNLVCLALMFAPLAPANLIITEVVDGTLTGAAPKFIELTNVGAVDYTFGGGGGVIVQANASLDYNVDIDMTGITILAGQTVVISASNTAQDAVFFDVYGFNPDFTGGSATFGNGDDRYIIVDNSTGGVADPGAILDIYGVDGVRGTGAVWEYTDSYAYRLPGMTGGNAGLFDEGTWFFGGINALEASFEGDNSYDPLEIGLLQTLTSPGVYVVPEPETFALLGGLAGLALVLRRRLRR